MFTETGIRLNSVVGQRLLSQVVVVLAAVVVGYSTKGNFDRRSLEAH